MPSSSSSSYSCEPCYTIETVTQVDSLCLPPLCPDDIDIRIVNYPSTICKDNNIYISWVIDSSLSNTAIYSNTVIINFNGEIQEYASQTNGEPYFVNIAALSQTGELTFKIMIIINGSFFYSDEKTILIEDCSDNGEYIVLATPCNNSLTSSNIYVREKAVPRIPYTYYSPFCPPSKPGEYSCFANGGSWITSYKTIYFKYDGDCYSITNENYLSKRLLSQDSLVPSDVDIVDLIDKTYSDCNSCAALIDECGFDAVEQLGIGSFNRIYYVGNTDYLLFEYNSVSTPYKFLLTNADTGEILCNTGCIITGGLQNIPINVIGVDRIDLTILSGCTMVQDNWRFKLACCSDVPLFSSSSSSSSSSSICFPTLAAKGYVYPGNYSYGIWGDGTYLYLTTSNNGLFAYTFDGTAFHLVNSVSPGGNAFSSMGDGTYLYLANGGNGVKAYTFIDSVFSPVGQFSPDPSMYTEHVFCYNGIIYISDFYNGLYACTFNGSAFTEIDHEPIGTVYKTWRGSADYVFAACGNTGLRAYSFDGSSFNLIDTVDNGSCYGVWGYGNYIYSSDGGNGLYIYTFDGTAFAEVGHLYVGGNSRSVWADSNNIYTADFSIGINVYSFDGSDITFVDNHNPGGSYAWQVWGDGTYIYLADGTAGLYAYELERCCGSGTGTEDDPILICDIEGLQSIMVDTGEYSYGPDKLSLYYKLISNIDASPTRYWNETSPGSGVYNGFVPIGSLSTKFYGTLDGDGFVIDGLYINRNGYSYAGLFGMIVNGANIENVTIDNASIVSGSNSGILIGIGGFTDFAGGTFATNCHVRNSAIVSTSSNVGGFIGNNYTCTTTLCSVDNCTVDGNDSIGGFSGYDSGSIIKCFSNCQVSGDSGVGGFVGKTYWAGSITECFAIGTVTSIGSYYGGFVGNDYYDNSGGIISNCYSIVSLGLSVTYSGGFFGVASPYSNQVISNCYSAGHTTGTTGKAFGGNDKIYITGCYYDQDISEDTDNPPATPQTTAQMKTESTFTSWNFTDIWAIDNLGVKNNGYPYLKWAENII